MVTTLGSRSPSAKPSGGAGAAALVCGMMFLEFFIWGAWYVSVGNYMAANGMKEAIAWAYTVGPIAAIVSPFFLGMVADRFFASERVLAGMHLIGGGARFGGAVPGHPPQPSPFIFMRPASNA